MWLDCIVMMEPVRQLSDDGCRVQTGINARIIAFDRAHEGGFSTSWPFA